jgi:hypothetical protein
MLGFIALHNGGDKPENLIDRSIPQILNASLEREYLTIYVLQYSERYIK